MPIEEFEPYYDEEDQDARITDIWRSMYEVQTLGMHNKKIINSKELVLEKINGCSIIIARGITPDGEIKAVVLHEFGNLIGMWLDGMKNDVYEWKDVQWLALVEERNTDEIKSLASERDINLDVLAYNWVPESSFANFPFLDEVAVNVNAGILNAFDVLPFYSDVAPRKKIQYFFD